MKRKLFLVCLFLTSIVATQAQNLFKNGNFEDGTANWNLGRGGFELGEEGNYKVIKTEYYTSIYGGPRISTEGQEVTIEPGKVYVFSIWQKGLKKENLKLKLFLKNEENNSKYITDKSQGIDYNQFLFDTVEEQDGWTKLSKEIVFPDDVAKLTKFAITLIGDDYNYKKIREISMVEKKVAQPIQNVQVTDKFQREALVVWDTASGVTSYTVQVGTMSETVEGSKYLVKGLEPGSTTTITVSAEGFALTEVVAETVSITTAEADRIPYVKFNNGVASTSFYPHIYDSTNAPTEVKVFLDGTELTADTNGYYTLTVGEGKKLKVTFKDGTQAYELMYIVNVQ